MTFHKGEPMYACPKCNSTGHLDVEAQVYVHLVQDFDEETFETEDTRRDTEHEWNEFSWMICRKCGKQSESRFFHLAED